MYCFIVFGNINRPDFKNLESIESAQSEKNVEVGTIIDDEWIVESPSSFSGEPLQTIIPSGQCYRKIKLKEIDIFESDILYEKAYLSLVDKTTRFINGTDILLYVYENIK